MGGKLDFGKIYGWVINHFVHNTWICIESFLREILPFQWFLALLLLPPRTKIFNAILQIRKLNTSKGFCFLLVLSSMHLSPFTADSRSWSLSSTCVFNVKSFFLALSMPPIPLLFHLAKFIWSSKAPAKVKAFAWLVAHRKVNTNDLLQLRRPYRSLNPQWCILCRGDEESIDHLFLRCPFTMWLWQNSST